MSEFDLAGLVRAHQEAFKPDYADVQRRTRRRRTRVQLVGVAAAAVLATGIGTGTALVPGGADNSPVGPVPVSSGWPSPGRHTQLGPMVVGDLRHLYLSYGDCHDSDCTVMVAASDNAGATWTRTPLPVPHNALVRLTALGPRTVLAWYQDTAGSAVGLRQGWLASTDGAATWHPVTVATVEQIPAGWRAIDYPGNLNSQPVLSGDPVTGDLRQLATPRPLTMARTLAGFPAGAGLWVTGHRGITPAPPSTGEQLIEPTGAVIEVSHDGGRTWQRYSFPEQLDAGENVLGGPTIATVDGQVAYAVGEADGTLIVYRTADGGSGWRRTDATLPVGKPRLYAALRGDGTLLVQVGDQTSGSPRLYQSTDQGHSLHEVPIGPGASATQVPGGYAQSDWPAGSGAWLSTDGIAWTAVAPPHVP